MSLLFYQNWLSMKTVQRRKQSDYNAFRFISITVMVKLFHLFLFCSNIDVCDNFYSIVHKNIRESTRTNSCL